MEAVKNHLLTESTQIFISERQIMAFDAKRELPDGYRQATSREVAYRYRHDEGFRSALSDYWIWVDQRGLNSVDFHRIHNDGTLTRTDASTYLELPIDSRAILRRGDGYVAITCSTDLNDGRLFLDALRGAMQIANVAYVKDSFYNEFRGSPHDSNRFKQHMRGAGPKGQSSDI